MASFDDYPDVRVDPRLEKELESVRRLPEGKAKSVKLAALEGEYNDQTTKGYAGPIYGQSTSTPAATDSFDAFPDVEVDEPATKVAKDEFAAFPDADDPGYIKSIGQGLATGLGSLADTATQLGATLADLGSNPISKAVLGDSTQYTDKLRDLGQDTKRYWGNLVLSDEEKKAQTLGQRVTSNLAAMGPTMLLGPAAAPAMAAQGTMQTGEAAIDAGETPETAVQAGLVQGAASGLMAGLPAAGKTVGDTLKYIALGGPISGAAADAVTQQLLDNDEFKKHFDPLSLENRLTEVAGGTAFAIPAWRNMADARMAAAADKLKAEKPEEYNRMIQELKTDLTELFKLNELSPYKQPHETNEEAFTRLTEDRQALIEHHLNQDDPNQRPVHISAAQALEVMYHNAENYQDKVKIKHMLDQAMDMGLDFTAIYGRREFEGEAVVGRYNSQRDLVSYATGEGTKQEIIGTMMHEIQHALHSRVISATDLIKKTPEKELSSDLKRLKDNGLVEAVDKLEQLREYVQERATKEGLDLDYPLSNRKEFLAALFNSRANPKFNETMEKMELNRSQIEQFIPKLDLNENHKYVELVQALRNHSDAMPRNVLDALIQNYVNVMQHNSLGLRSQRVHSNVDQQYIKRDDVSERGAGRFAARHDWVEKLSGSSHKRFMTRRLYNALHNAASYDEFLTNAHFVSNSKDWEDLLRTHGRTLYDRGQLFYQDRSATSNYSKLTDDQRLLALEDRTVQEFMRDEMKRAGVEGSEWRDKLPIDDISKYGTDLNNPNVIRLLKSEGFAGRAIKFILDKMEQKAYQGNILYHEMKAMSKEYDSLPLKQKRKVFAVGAFYDSTEGRTALVNRGLQWPDERMLRRQGLNDVQVSAYQKLTQGMDRAYNLLNQQHKKRFNGAELKQIPGYMPHFHDGAFKVFVQSKKTGQIVRVQGFNTKLGANAFAEKVLKDGDLQIQTNLKGKNYHVAKYGEVGESLLDAYRQHSEAFFNLSQLGEAGVRELQRVETESMHDFGKHMLERSGVKGFQGELGAEPNATWKATDKLAYYLLGRSKALEIHDRYFKQVAESWKNTMFLMDDFVPLMSIDTGQMDGRLLHGNVFQHLPETASYIRRVSRNFIGEPINKFKPVDETLYNISLALGVNPHMYREFARSARNFLSLVKLRVNPANYWNNAAQLLHTNNWLLYTNARFGLTGNPLKAFAKVLKDSYAPDEGVRAAIRWAKENHILEPQLDAELRSQKQSTVHKVADVATAGRVNPAVERFARYTSFVVAFEHFRTQFGGDEVRAREAAQLVMQSVMVNYDRMARPLMYQNYGVIGEMASPFAVFRNAYLGNTYLMLKLIAQKPKELAAYAPFIASQASYLMLAGAMGMVGVSEYNVLADLINGLLEDDWMPRFEDLLMRLNAPDLIIYGGPAELTKLFPGMEEGAAIGSSGAAVGIDDLTSAAMMPFLGAVKEIGTLTGKAAASIMFDTPSPSYSDLYKPGKQFIPGVFQNEWESLFKGEGGEDVAFKSSSLEATVNRTDAGRLAIRLTGKPSVKESKDRSIERSVDRGGSLEKKAQASIVKKAADLYEGKPSMDTMEELEQKATLKYGLTQEEFHNRILAEVNTRRTIARNRDAKAAASGSTAAYRRYIRREELEGTR